jgi:hypothetical protein
MGLNAVTSMLGTAVRIGSLADPLSCLSKPPPGGLVSTGLVYAGASSYSGGCSAGIWNPRSDTFPPDGGVRLIERAEMDEPRDRVDSREMNSKPSPSVPGLCVSKLPRVETERTDDADRPLTWCEGVRDMPLIEAAESSSGRLSESVEPARSREPSCRATPRLPYWTAETRLSRPCCRA